MGEVLDFLGYLLLELPAQTLLFFSGSPLLGIAAVGVVILLLLLVGRKRRSRRRNKH